VKKAAYIFLMLFFVIGLLSSKTTRGQESILGKKFSFDFMDKQVYEALIEINQTINYKFSYDSELIDDKQTVSLTIKELPLREILNSLFGDTALVYELIGNHIVIYKKNQHAIITPEKQLNLPPSHDTLPGKKNPSPRESLFKNKNLGYIDTSYIHKWNKDSARWELFNRTTKYYSPGHLLLGTLNERWQKNSNTWVNFNRTIKNYNLNQKPIESLHQKWNTAQQKWNNLQLKTYAYDRLGNNSEMLYHEWQQAAGQWFSYVRYLIDYNNYGEKSEVLIKIYSPATESWSNDTRYTFIYDDGFGPPDETLVESWNSFTEAWDSRGKYSLQYNFRGDKVLETRSTWNQSMNKWINGLRFLMDYKKQNLTSEVEQRWDFRSNKWNNAVRNVFSYDSQGEIQQRVNERWNRDSSRWETKDIFIYSDMESSSENEKPFSSKAKKK
jgi:hypothetical protein